MNTRQRIEQVYELLKRIPVAGDAVDVMATVRQELRTIHKIIIAEDAKANLKTPPPAKKPKPAPAKEGKVIDNG